MVEVEAFLTNTNWIRTRRIFSRADSDRALPFDIHQGINSALLILKHRLKANEFRPEIEVTKNYGQLPLVECCAGQLNQVFMNLLANAIDALDESNQGLSYEQIQSNPNQISITTDHSFDQQFVVITIQDNGIGMSETVQQKAFEHLFTTKEAGTGTGLGLSIAHQIITEKHRGAIAVDSLVNHGTKFVITIPVRV
jgi:two-component system, NtrC family, sensor kinase